MHVHSQDRSAFLRRVYDVIGEKEAWNEVRSRLDNAINAVVIVTLHPVGFNSISIAFLGNNDLSWVHGGLVTLTGLVGSKIGKNMWRDAVTCFSTGKVKLIVASQLQCFKYLWPSRQESWHKKKKERKWEVINRDEKREEKTWRMTLRDETSRQDERRQAKIWGKKYYTTREYPRVSFPSEICWFETANVA